MLAPTVASAQVFVYPRRPFQSQVRYDDFSWRHIDLGIADIRVENGATASVPEPPPAVAGPAESMQAPSSVVLKRPEDTRGAVRLYFYEEERAIAERAAASIATTYRELAEAFGTVPARRLPYILYSSYHEFLQTNLFPVQEGTLGVTSTEDLRLALPYFGDHRRFEEVSRHEMAHQFTIAKVRALTQRADGRGDPLNVTPLWFIEGVAEHYAKGGIDAEADMLVRDLIVSPTDETPKIDLFSDKPYSVLWTYKLGLVRCAYLEQTYGKGTLQAILEALPRLVARGSQLGPVPTFQAVVGKVTATPPEQLDRRFVDWLKRRAFNAYLDAEQTQLVALKLAGEEPWIDAMTASPSGNAIMYRGVDVDLGQFRLALIDPRAPRRDVTVAVDGVPGVESLHPVEERNFSLTEDALVYVAEDRGHDVLYWQSYEHRAELQRHDDEETVATPRNPGWVADAPTDDWRVRISLGTRRTYALESQGLRAAFAPTFSPDGKQVALVGLDTDGNKDIYVLTPTGEASFELSRITHDVYAERELSWGAGGIVYATDATADGRYNLYVVNPKTASPPVRLTSEARDNASPLVLGDARTLYVAYDDKARANVYEVSSTGERQRTHVATGLLAIAPAPEGGLWALMHQEGKRQLVRIDADALQDSPVPPWSVATTPRPLAHRSLAGAERYDALALNNWELGTLFGFFGASSSGIFGQLLASAHDRLSDHGVIANIAAYGATELVDGYLLYVNQAGRTTWATGPFQSLQYRIDTHEPDVEGGILSVERFYGGMVTWRYPFDRFIYAELSGGLGAVSDYLSDSSRSYLADPAANEAGRDLLTPWRARHHGTRMRGESTLRFGYDTIRYNWATGPVAGRSLLLELQGGAEPKNGQTYSSARLDAEHYLHLTGSANLFVRLGTGVSAGGRLRPTFYLSSFDTLRGVPFGDSTLLLGTHFFYSTAEMQFPLNAVIRLFIFSDLEGIVGMDFGGVGDGPNRAWRHRVLDYALGINLGFGPLVFRIHFAKPIPLVAGSVRKAWLPNLSLTWRYL